MGIYPCGWNGGAENGGGARMKFSDVAAVLIPEGEVVMISSGGNVLWEAIAQGGLPIGYTILEYVEFTGQQYVDTGIIPTQDTTIKMTFDRADETARYLFGAVSSDNKASVTGYQSGVGNGTWRFGAASARPAVTAGVKHEIVIDKTGILWDGSIKRYAGTVGTFTAPVSLVLGTSKSASGSIGTVRHIGKMYAFQMLDGDDLIADYIPCKNRENVCGFYDAVGKAFIPSASDTPFEGG